VRFMKTVERSFVRALVADVSDLVQATKPVHEKVAVLHFRAAKHQLKLEALKQRIPEGQIDPVQNDRLRQSLELRAKAVAYLRATAKYLLHKERHPLGLRQRPRFFAEPGWELTKKAPASHRTKVWPFMEFSS